MDVRVPQWVKQNYSPREQWKNRPFTRQDALFFLKGIRELSELFTEDRPHRLPNYFSHPKFRSSYLLYFLPLQAAKFFSLFHAHQAAIERALSHARTQGVLRVVDLGSGPGTASMALLIYLVDYLKKEGTPFPRVELDWFDLNRSVLEEGKKLIHDLGDLVPEIKENLFIRTHAVSWTESNRIVPQAPSLILVGNMLNEESLSIRSMSSRSDSRKSASKADRGQGAFVRNEDQQEDDSWRAPEDQLNPVLQSPAYRTLSQWIARAAGGGILIVEPAAKTPSRMISVLRDSLFETEILPQKADSLWGPCLHAGKCPLSQGRDWCHFSIPSEIPGENFKFFSKGLGSERHWLKFSFLWIASLEAPASQQKLAPHQSRVVSDVIHPPGGSSGIQKDRGIVLLCEPEQPVRISSKEARSSDGAPLQRGDLYSPSTKKSVPSTGVSQQRVAEPTRKKSQRIQVRFKNSGRRG